jgi:tetratricopeptide (TPR) repeat protein
MEQFKRIDEKIQKGYALILENDCLGGCERWLEAWDEIKNLFAEGIATDIFELDGKYKWTQFPSNYVQDLEMELHNAGVDDRAYHQKRIVYCQELIQWGGKDELLASNTRISMAEAYFELGDTAAAEQLYKEWLRDDPDWGWGYIGWSEYYYYDKQYEKAQEILLAGYAREGLRDKIDLTGRLVELYGDTNRPDKVKEVKKIFSDHDDVNLERCPLHKPEPAQVPKIGRNEPCPCSSGKKYKKCCGT